jgi:putative NADH-flavin reductase
LHSLRAFQAAYCIQAHRSSHPIFTEGAVGSGAGFSQEGQEFRMSQISGLSGLIGMRLFVIGANGRTGTEIVDLARSKGHQVTAFVRSSRKIESNGSVTVVEGDPLRSETMTPALSGHDAVLSVIGPHPREAFRPSTLVADCARATVEAMLQTDVRRLAVVSAAVLFPEKGLYFRFFHWLIKHHARDLRAMEVIVRASSLAWTIARPPRLTKSSDEGFRALTDALPPGSRAMSFRSVAAFLLDAVERKSHVSEVVGLGPAL